MAGQFELRIRAGRDWAAPLEGTRIVIGCDPSCDVVLPDDGRTARRHAILHLAPEGPSLVDLQTTSGTLLNDVPISNAGLVHLDRIGIGGAILVFRDAGREIDPDEMADLLRHEGIVAAGSFAWPGISLVPVEPVADDAAIIRRLADIARENDEMRARAEREAEAGGRFVGAVGRRVVDAVRNGALHFTPQGRADDLTILFARLHAFEENPLDTLPARLNAIFEDLADRIFEHDGVVCQFLKHRLLALFGGPWTTYAADEAARQAVRAAAAIAPLGACVGMACGPVRLGRVGARRRSTVSAQGDAVNVGARLCGLAAPGEILVSAPLADRLGTTLTPRHGLTHKSGEPLPAFVP
ncbi:MAG: FHA domain-containing protein [Armatimonadetes bacterium]|nr:FHA domain-containing protein [Armatimonadota bacterium]